MSKKRKKDPFNQKIADYSTFINQLYKAVNTNAAAWHIDPLIVTAFLATLTPFNTAYAISKEKATATSANRATTRGTRAVVNRFARPFVLKWIYLNEDMDDADIITCGLQPRDKNKTPVGVPETEPDMYLKPTTSHNIVGSFRQPKGEDGSSKRGKPAGVMSARVAVFVGDVVPDEPDNYGKFYSFTTTSGTIPFPAVQAGKKVTIASCWVNEKEEQGDWCDPQTMNVP